VNAGERLTDMLKRNYPWCSDEAEGIREIFRAYTERKRRQHVLDYDDLLLFWKALATSPATGPQFAAMFEHILVDEYRDTNALEADILEGMRPAAGPRNLTVVGVDAQAIYGFRVGGRLLPEQAGPAATLSRERVRPRAAEPIHRPRQVPRIRSLPPRCVSDQ
jgi:superfamily I DNA/RNA helicase